jgi:tetratricopeptide (TPR) repeat protein
VAAQPRFAPAWGRLLYADMFAIDFAGFGVGDESKAVGDLRQDMDKVRKVAPDLPELILAEVKLLPPTAYFKRLELLAKAAERAPDKAEVFADQNSAFQQVGRMSDAVEAARRAAELDPLSPTMTTQLIMTRAYAGQLEEARKELARAERLWAGTGALRDALWGFHLRYGDPTVAREKAPAQQSGEGLNLYLNTRADPSPINVEKFASYLRQFESKTDMGMTGWAIQALGEFDRVDEAFSWIARTPTDTVAVHAYLLFRPALAGVRRDSRFMQVAKRIGLIDYWRSSGKWPDFCGDPSLPYNCKVEAAKYD